MEEKSKLIFIGPPGVGKTTIKKVYFEHSNPLELLLSSLEPSRGSNSSVFSYFTKSISIFDLAGQELEHWLTDEKHVFKSSRAIICVFEINLSSEFIVNFLLRILRIKKELNLSSCKISVLFHKVDLSQKTYIDKKVQEIMKFFKIHYPNAESFKIFKTSIQKDYFLQTWIAIYEILRPLLDDVQRLTDKDYMFLKKNTSILMELEYNEIYNKNEIAKSLRLEMDELEVHINQLKKIGFVKIIGDSDSVQLTDKALFFKSYNSKSEAESIITEKETLNLIYTFANFIEIEI